MRFRVNDIEFALLTEDDLMWAEADAVERVTGLTMAEIGARGQVCGCGDRMAAHKPVDPEDLGQGFLCSCGCDQPMPNLPSTVTQALLWVSMKRASPELTFRQVGETSMAQMTPLDDVGAPDPPVGEATA